MKRIQVLLGVLVVSLLLQACAAVTETDAVETARETDIVEAAREADIVETAREADIVETPGEASISPAYNYDEPVDCVIPANEKAATCRIKNLYTGVINGIRATWMEGDEQKFVVEAQNKECQITNSETESKCDIEELTNIGNEVIVDIEIHTQDGKEVSRATRFGIVFHYNGSSPLPDCCL